MLVFEAKVDLVELEEVLQRPNHIEFIIKVVVAHAVAEEEVSLALLEASLEHLLGVLMVDHLVLQAVEDAGWAGDLVDLRGIVESLLDEVVSDLATDRSRNMIDALDWAHEHEALGIELGSKKAGRPRSNRSTADDYVRLLDLESLLQEVVDNLSILQDLLGCTLR